MYLLYCFTSVLQCYAHTVMIEDILKQIRHVRLEIVKELES